MKRTLLFVSMSYVALIVFLLEVITQTPSDTKIPTSSNHMTQEAENEVLMENIQNFAHNNKIEPIDAQIDRIWKAIPGYNGIEVDIEKSYLNMLTTDTFTEEQIVYQETPPNIHLKDLSPSPIYKGNSEKPMVTLLINVAWGNEFIPPILDILKKQEVQATFFFDGSWVKENPGLAKTIYKDHHEIGNHAYSHPDLNTYSKAQTTKELKKTNAIIKKTLGLKPLWFAPPSGSFKQDTVDVANELGMMTILWTVDTVDWKKPESAAMVARVISKIENGSMILMHPTQPTAQGLNQMINSIKEKGYQIGTVSDLMSEKRITKNR